MGSLFQSPFTLLEPSEYLQLLLQRLPPSNFHLEEWEQLRIALPLSPQAATRAIVDVVRNLRAYPRLLHGANCLILPRYKIHCLTTTSEVQHFVISDQETRQCEIYSFTDSGITTSTSRQEIQRLLLENAEWGQEFGSVSDKDLLACVAQVLQEILDDPQTEQSFQSTVRRCLDRLGKAGVLPPSVFVHFVNSDIPKHETMQKFTISGGFCDAHKIIVNDVPICFRVLRQWENSDSDKIVFKQFCRELSVWYQLRHPNVLPLIGATTEAFSERYCFLVPWLSNGSLSSYLKTHPEHDKYLAVTQIVEGLNYLHGLDPPIGHKDLKAVNLITHRLRIGAQRLCNPLKDNVLVGEDLVCVITDFGLASMLDTHRSTTRGRGSQFWQAPELGLEEVPDQDCRPRDIYSLGSTIAEILTGRAPKSIWFSVLKGIPLTLPPPRTPDWGQKEQILWNIAKICVEAIPGQRPVVSNIKSLLQANLLQLETNLPLQDPPDPTTRITSMGINSTSKLTSTQASLGLINRVAAGSKMAVGVSKRLSFTQTRPYDGQGGPKKLLARTKLKAEKEDGLWTSSAAVIKEPSPQIAAVPPPATPNSDWFATTVSGPLSSSPGSSLRIGRQKRTVHRIQRPSQSRLSKAEEMQMMEEATKKVSVFQIPTNLSFAQDASASENLQINTPFRFGQVKNHSRPSSAGAFDFGQTPAPTTSAPVFPFSRVPASNPFTQTATRLVPSSYSTVNQPFSFGASTPPAAVASNPFGFRSQPAFAADGILTLPPPTVSTTFGDGTGFGQTPSSFSPFTSPQGQPQSASGGHSFTIGAAPAPSCSGRRLLMKLPRRKAVKSRSHLKY